MNLRPADKAGSWYPASAAELAAEVDRCLALAPERYGDARPTPDTVPVALVAPHAGLAYSGPVAAAAFRLVREALAKVDAFVVFGACHRAWLARPALWPDGAWDTPLGPVPVDADLARLLAAAGVAEPNPGVHLGDNAIELLTPFIRRLFPEAALVPVALSATPDAAAVGHAAAALADSGKTVVAAASTDLTHYGAAFDLMPAGSGPGAVAWTKENDRPFLDALLAMDAGSLVATAARDSSACGAGAAAAAVAWAAARGAASGRLLAHTNSYEIMPRGPADHLVGYAAAVFEAPGR